MRCLCVYLCLCAHARAVSCRSNKKRAAKWTIRCCWPAATHFTVKCKRNIQKKNEKKSLLRVLDTILFRLFCTLLFSTFNESGHQSTENGGHNARHTIDVVFFSSFFFFSFFVFFGRRPYAFIQTAHLGRHEEKKRNEMKREKKKKNESLSFGSLYPRSHCDSFECKYGDCR